jgi:hypothetical protein
LQFWQLASGLGPGPFPASTEGATKQTIRATTAKAINFLDMVSSFPSGLSKRKAELLVVPIRVILMAIRLALR